MHVRISWVVQLCSIRETVLNTNVNIASGIYISYNDVIPAAVVVQIHITVVCWHDYIRSVVLEAGIKGRDK